MAKVAQPNWTDFRAKFIKAGKRKVVGVVLHDTAGTGTHNDTKYLANPGDGRKVSCDFTVERDGSIWKLNPDLDNFYTLHAGRATAFKGLRNGQVTRGTVGIEICQKVDLSLSPTYTDAQVHSVADLCAWLVDKYGLAPSDITTHRNVITDGSRSDPRKFPFEGANGFWSFYWKAFGKQDEHAASQTVALTPDPTSEKRTYKVLPGEGLIAIARKVYGEKNGNLFTLIVKANNIKNNLVLPGQVLTIPDPPK